MNGDSEEWLCIVDGCGMRMPRSQKDAHLDEHVVFGQNGRRIVA